MVEGEGGAPMPGGEKWSARRLAVEMAVRTGDLRLWDRGWAMQS